MLKITSFLTALNVQQVQSQEKSSLKFIQVGPGQCRGRKGSVNNEGQFKGPEGAGNQQVMTDNCKCKYLIDSSKHWS